MSGGDGNDEVFGGSGNDTLFGDEGDDVLSATGPAGPGEAGDDSISGGPGNDTLVDCIDHNRLNGNDGVDTCEFNALMSSAASCENVITCP